MSCHFSTGSHTFRLAEWLGVDIAFSILSRVNSIFIVSTRQEIKPHLKNRAKYTEMRWKKKIANMMEKEHLG